MKNMRILLLMLFVNVFVYGQDIPNYVANEIIVKFKDGSLESKDAVNNFKRSSLSELHSEIDVSEYQTIGSKYTSSTVLIKYNSNEFSLNEIIAKYENTGDFEYVEPNYIATGSGVMNTRPNDAQYKKQWGMKNDGTFSATAKSGADTDMELAWDIETGDPNLIVAIIDTGARLSHPEFAGRIWTNPNEVADGKDTDRNGYVDDLVAGWDFVNNDNDPTDDHGHGTNVAGIALATGNNNIGYAGVNWKSKIMICKALDANNSGSFAAIANSIYYAVDNGAKVINMSIGGTGASSTLKNAADYCYSKGAILVVCMMNFNNSVKYYPAAFSNTLAIGSTDPDDTRSSPFFWDPTSGSNYGDHIDIVAPGNFMYGLSHTSNTNYSSYWGGTSQATPMVAGVVSLLLSKDPTLTFSQIRTILRESSEDQVGKPSEDKRGFDIYYGYGRLNAYKALTHTLLSVDDFENNSDSVLIYPNPVSNEQSLTLRNLNPGDYKINIYNSLGQNLLTVNKNIDTNSNIDLQLPELTSGTYFVKIENQSKNTFINKKLIIK